MSQQQNPGRGPHQGRGGRGGQPYYPPAAGRGQPPQGRGGPPPSGPRPPMGAWQPSPAPPTNMPYGAGPPQAGRGYPPQNYYNPYAQPNPYAQRGGVYYPQQNMPQNMRGGVFYPPQQMQQGTPPSSANTPPVVIAPREKKPLVITDKDGNVIDLSAPKKTTAPAPAPTPVTPPAESDAGAKMKQAALEKLKAEEKAKQEAEEKAKKEAEEKAKKEAEEKAKKEAEEKTKNEAEEKATKEADEKAAAAAAAAKPQQPKTALQALMQKKAPPAPAPDAGSTKRYVYSKEMLNQIRATVPTDRPDSLPDLTITKLPPRGGGRGKNQGDWKHGGGGPRRQGSRNEGGGNEWSRGQAPPRAKNDRRGGRGGRGGNQPPLYDGPVAPLVKSENHWRPKKNTSPFIVAEKKVKGLLNKMTKEKFDRLSEQMIEIPLRSYEVLTLIIENIYDKAIDEPTFGDMYADLCVRLSQSASSNASFIHIIESDEEPPTENEANGEAKEGESTSNPVYRWSNDISTSDSEIIGPFDSVDECIEVALDGEEDPETVDGSEMELKLEQVMIKSGIFIKVLKGKASNGAVEFYTVFFPVEEAEECGQQLSQIFLSKVECESDATKKNSFKRSLLNKCEEEFNKQDIYVDWKKEKAAYEEKKSTLSEAEQAETEEELDFRRIRIKKQMLGNIKFIGQLYKKGLLKEKIMRYCIASLLKLKELKDRTGKNPEYEDSGERDMDEEDHEAICSMFTTIGNTIDKPSAAEFMGVCFTKITSLSTDEVLPMRSRFMYKDLLELRANKWVPRRKVEKAKTLEEIRKDVEREERKQAMQGRGGGGGGGGDRRGSQRSDNRGGKQQAQPKRQQPPKAAVQTDSDGFTTIVSNRSSVPNLKEASKTQNKPKAEPVQSTPSAFEALSEDSNQNGQSQPVALDHDTLKKKIKGMVVDYMNDGGNVDELMLTMNELAGTPDAGREIVMQNADNMMEVKEAERRAIVSVVATLVEKKRISSDDVKGGLSDPLEFLDSTMVDVPKACEYMGDYMAEFLLQEVIDIPYFCEQAKKPNSTSPDKKVGEKLTRATISAVKRLSDLDTARQMFGATNETELVDLLGDECYKSLSKELL